MVQWCRRVADSGAFQNAILAVILMAAVVVGLETSAALTTRYASVFQAADRVIQAVFVVELTIRLVAFWPRPYAFFRDGWNTFDFVIVAASFLPAAGAFATVGRLARLLRASRLLSRVPELRLIIGTMMRSMRSMTHVVLLLCVLLYVYAVLGVHLFHEADPARWSDLSRAVLTLLGVLTLEGWVEVQGAVLERHPFAWVYFLSFIVLAVFVGLNLFIAIVINNLEETKAEFAAALSGERPAAPPASQDRGRLIAEIRERLAMIE